MPKVTFSNAKGILQEAGSGFQVNDAPILMESESVAGNAVITLTPDITDSGAGEAAIDITGKYFTIATPDERFYVWFDGGDADTEDPTPGNLTAANSIRLSESPAQLDTLAKVCSAITARLTTANNATGLDYSDTAADGDATVCTAVLGPADTDEVPDGADTAGLGADTVGDKFSVTDDGSVVTIVVLPVGSADGSLGDTLHTTVGDLTNLGTGDDGLDDDWAIEYTNGTGNNGSALQAFGTSVISNAHGSATCTATLANATAGTKKLIVQSGAGAIDVTFNDPAGSSVTAQFNADGESLYLISTSLGWGTLNNTGSITVS